jgi:hypothetical protein
VERYAAHSGVPGFADLLKRGASATGDGMLTQAPPNTGAGWYTMATGAWPGVHGSTNNTFHINSQPFTPNRTTAFDAGVLSAETIAQAAERGGKRVIQMEWAGRRNGVIAGPTVDFRTFLSGRGVTTNFVSPSDRPALIAAFGLQYDPADPALTVPFTDHPVPTATGWTNVPASFSPALETHMAVLDFGVDKYGQDAYIYDSTNDRAVNYDGVLFSRGKNGSNQVADLAKGALADVKVTIQGGALNGRTGGMLVKVEELSSDASRVRLFHTSVTRANATWAGWPGEPGFTGDFAEFVAQRFPTSTAGDFAVLEAGIVSEETYVEQGLYWEKAHHPLLEYMIETYRPDLALVGYPVTDEFQHQFLGLVTRTMPDGSPNPAYDNVDLPDDRTPDGRVEEREGFIRRSYEGAELSESQLGDLVADAMRAKYPGIDAALTNSGGLRADLLFAPPTAGEQPGEITWGEVFAVLPFGNRTVILTLTGAQLEQAFLNGFSPACNTSIATGRFPQISGLTATYTCNGTTPVVTGMWKAPNGPGGTLTPIGPTDTVRLVTNDFMFTGGDGYTVLANGTDVAQPGDALLDIVVDDITASSPVSPEFPATITGSGACAAPNVCRIVRQ